MSDLNGNGHRAPVHVGVDGAPTEDWAGFYGYDQGFEAGRESGRREGYQAGFARRETLYETDHGGGGGFATRAVDLSKMKPVEFVYRPFIVRGRSNEIVGEEDIGKSTFEAHIAARLTRGELPGCFEGRPVKVLFIGTDEDDFSSVTVPRLHAAGADFDHVREFCALDESSLFNVEDHASDLGRLLDAEEFGLVIVEHVLDVLPRLKNAYEPMALRRALRPLARVLGVRGSTALMARHVNKGEATSFRQRAQGSMQLGAVSRSSFLIDRHPADPLARVVVLGKANYVRAEDRTAVSFRIADHTFEFNGARFSVGRVVDLAQTDLTVGDVLAGPASARERQHEDKRRKVIDALDDVEISGRSVAKFAGLSEPTTRRILNDLKDDGEAARGPGGGWVRQCVTASSPIGSDAVTHPPSGGSDAMDLPLTDQEHAERLIGEER